MKPIRFSEEKDSRLRELRGVGFKEIGLAISQGKLIKIIEHPNKKKYRKQKIFLVRLENYIYAVPFVEEAEYLFLKTVYPSRRYTKKYIENIKNQKNS